MFLNYKNAKESILNEIDIDHEYVQIRILNRETL